jgi:hypothetical protein
MNPKAKSLQNRPPVALGQFLKSRLVQVRFGSVFGAFVPNPEPDLEFGSTEIPNLNRTWGSVRAVQVRFGRTLALFGKRSGEFGLLPEREPELGSRFGQKVEPWTELRFGSIGSRFEPGSRTEPGQVYLKARKHFKASFL